MKNITLRATAVEVSTTWDREVLLEITEPSESDFLSELVKNFEVKDILNELDESDIITYVEKQGYVLKDE